MSSKGVYQGFLTLSIIYFFVATFMCTSLLEYCAPNWQTTNVVVSLIVESIIIFYGAIYIIRESSKLVNITHSLNQLKDLYGRILLLMGFSLAFSLIIFVFVGGGPEVGCTGLDAITLYAIDIAIPALFFFIQMWIRLREIEKIMKRL